jgi:MFS family permease
LIGISVVINIGIVMQSAASGKLGALYAGRFISGVGVGAASTINPIYVSENAPRAIRGLLTGLYQLFIVTGGMIAFWINYSVSVHMTGKTMYIFPLAIQALPATLLALSMLLCNESPRWLATKDRWEESKRILCKTRNLPPDHPYIEDEFQEIVDQLEFERRLIGNASTWNLFKEMFTVAGNRKRAIISSMYSTPHYTRLAATRSLIDLPVTLMICQQMTGKSKPAAP